MRFDIITIFPDFFAGPLDYGIVRRAREAGIAEVHVHDLRGWTHDRHKTVDDRPFGGGEGMVLKPEPIFEAVESLLGKKSTAVSAEDAEKTAVVLLSASGKLFRQETARRLAGLERIVLICGRYEGVDERVAEHLATDELSIGDFVLSGGELAAALVVDAVTRLLPGALGNEASTMQESFSLSTDVQAVEARHSAPLQARPPADASAIGTRQNVLIHALELVAKFESRVMDHGILDFPHYTRPAEYRGWTVPEVLVSGNHAEIAQWRRRAALEKTLRNRPELLAEAALTETEARLLAGRNK